MFEVRGSAAFATMGDLKTQARRTVEMAQERPVYLLRDGEPVGGIVSMEMLDILQEALEDGYVAQVARERLDAIREGAEDLIDEEEFWARADAVVGSRR